MIDVDDAWFEQWIDDYDDGVVGVTDIGLETDCTNCVNCETADCSNCEKNAICIIHINHASTPVQTA